MLWAAEWMAQGAFGIGTGIVLGWGMAIIFLYLIFMTAAANGIKASGLTGTDILTAFLGFCLNAVLVWITAAAILSDLPPGTRKAFGYFQGNYKASKPGTPGAIGRGNVIVFFTTIVLIAMTFAALAILHDGW